MVNNTMSALEGLTIGHAHNLDGPTGCTVVLCPPGTVGGVDQRGGAPGTRETDLLRPMHMVEEVHAIVLAGGSAYGLEARGTGVDVGVARVPIVPAAIIFDLDLGDPSIRPDAAMGYAACEAATDALAVEGCVGAGAGARVGMLAGPSYGCKSGIGSALVDLGDGLLVAALFVVNAAGDVIDVDGSIMVGPRRPPDGDAFLGADVLLRQMARMTMSPRQPSNTVIGVVATNARLSKEETNKVAQMAHDGLARAVRPAHTMVDGDTIFALATGRAGRANISAIGAAAADAAEEAIRRGVRAATPLAGLPAYPVFGESQD